MQGEDGEPRFCLADICKALGLQTKFVRQRLEKGIVSNRLLQTTGDKQVMTFVNEEGLYDTILESRKPETRRFRQWVTGEVLSLHPQVWGLHDRLDHRETAGICKAFGLLTKKVIQRLTDEVISNDPSPTALEDRIL